MAPVISSVWPNGFNYLFLFFFISSIPDCPGVGCLDSCLPRFSVVCLLHRESFYLHILLHTVHPFSFWSLPSAASNFHSYDVLHCFSIISSWHMPEPPQSSFSHLFYNVLYSTSSFDLRISYKPPTIHRSIRISVLRIKSSSFFLIIQHSVPYISTDLTTVLYVLLFILFGIPLSNITPAISFILPLFFVSQLSGASF